MGTPLGLEYVLYSYMDSLGQGAGFKIWCFGLGVLDVGLGLGLLTHGPHNGLSQGPDPLPLNLNPEPHPYKSL